jgi:hypothetical protein
MANDEVKNEGNSAETVAGRRRIAKILLIAFAAFIVVVQVATFVSRAQTTSTGREAQRYHDGGNWSGRDFVAIDAQVIAITPAVATQSLRLTIVPHGRYAQNGGELAQTINLDADGVAGGTATLLKGEIPPPVMLSLDLVGDPSQYPLDRYSANLTVNLRPVVNGKRSEAPVPAVLTVSSAKHDWSTGSSLVQRNEREISVQLTAARGTASIGFALFELLVMLFLAIISVAITYAAIISPKPLEFSLFVWLGAMLFALPAVRGTMPGVPGVGTMADFGVFFWCLFAVASCLIVAAITYVRTSLRHNREHLED